MFSQYELDEHNRICDAKLADAAVRSVEITEEVLEGVRVWKATYFKGGLDVAMYRFDEMDTLVNSIRQFYRSGRPL